MSDVKDLSFYKTPTLDGICEVFNELTYNLVKQYKREGLSKEEYNFEYYKVIDYSFWTFIINLVSDYIITNDIQYENIITDNLRYVANLPQEAIRDIHIFLYDNREVIEKNATDYAYQVYNYISEEEYGIEEIFTSSVDPKTISVTVVYFPVN